MFTPENFPILTESVEQNKHQAELDTGSAKQGNL